MGEILKTIISGYLQEDLIKHELDLTDIEIIKYFQQFAQSKNMKFIEKNNKLYFWLSYQKVIDDLPILNIKSKRTIARRFDALEEKGIFEKTIVNEGLKNFTYFRLTELHQSWVESMDIKFKDTKKTKEVTVEVDEVPYKEIIEYLNEVTGQNFKNVEGNNKHIRARWNENYNIKDFKKVVDVKSKEWLNSKWTDNRSGKTVYGKDFLRPRTLFGTKFDEYLNEGNEQNAKNANTSIYDTPIL